MFRPVQSESYDHQTYAGAVLGETAVGCRLLFALFIVLALSFLLYSISISD